MKHIPKKVAISLESAITIIEEKYGKEPLFSKKAKEIKKRLDSQETIKQ
jgi:hypothetical protein